MLSVVYLKYLLYSFVLASSSRVKIIKIIIVLRNGY